MIYRRLKSLIKFFISVRKLTGRITRNDFIILVKKCHSVSWDLSEYFRIGTSPLIRNQPFHFFSIGWHVIFNGGPPEYAGLDIAVATYLDVKKKDWLQLNRRRM